MSLINQMLKDLDKRQGNVGSVGSGAPLSVDVRLSGPARKSYGPMFTTVILALAVAATAVGAVAWYKNHKSSPSPVTQPVVVAAANPAPAPVPPVPQAVAEAAPAAPLPPVAVQPTAKPEAAAVPKEVVKEAVKETPPAMPAKPKAAVEQAATKPVAGAMASKNTPQESADTPQRSVPKPPSATPKSPDSDGASFKVVSAQQKSENFYREAVSLMQQSRGADAQRALRQSLAANAQNHVARQMLAGLLVDAGRNDEAITLLRDGLALAPGHSGFTMALARLQVAAGTTAEASATLEQGLPNAGDDAEYHAFYATLLQNQGRNAEAIQHYIIALRSNPMMSNWLIGVGISLQAENKLADATEAFQRAISSGELSPELTQFANQHLEQMRQQR
jgi:MSHA biogenesis protein MshN